MDAQRIHKVTIASVALVGLITLAAAGAFVTARYINMTADSHIVAADPPGDVEPNQTEEQRGSNPVRDQSTAEAEQCPGNPTALGTSRTLVVDPQEHGRIGAMSYAETLPLLDNEVVLTFDDGPERPHTGEVLNILASECVRATFFIVGRMAKGSS